MSFINEEQLKKAMKNALSGASLYTMKETVEKLQDHIEKEVYGAYTPEVYEDTFEFLDAWETQSSSDGGAEMHYDPNDIITTNPPIHASIITGEGVAEILPDWIFKGNAGGLFGNGEWNRKRDAWGALDREMSNRVFRSMYEDGMTSQGIPWVRSNGAVLKIEE